MKKFWDDNEYSLKQYVGEFPNDELIKSVEEELGYKLPATYIELMKTHNGGTPFNTYFPTKEAIGSASNHVVISGIYGIGREKPYSLCGAMGSKFMMDEWGYPSVGIYICDCPSAGHDMVALDYRKCGKNGEPQVVHVDQESDYKITFLAENFESFVKGLISKES